MLIAFYRTNGSTPHILNEDEKMTQCLRVATCVLREAVPSSGSSTRRKLLLITKLHMTFTETPLAATIGTLSLHVNLIKSAFTAFADLADLYPMPMREDLYCVAFHFYSRKFT